MHPLVIIAAAAAAWWLGQEYLRRKEAGTLPWEGPKALPPLSSEVPTSPEGAANLDAWAQIDHAADLFPASARRQWLPPPTADGMSIAPDCSAVAVGHGWWAHVARAASDGYTAGLSHPAIMTAIRLELMAPGFAACQTTPAGRALLDEVDRRVKRGRYLEVHFIPPSSGGPQHGGVYFPNPTRSRTNSIAEALVFAAARRRRR